MYYYNEIFYNEISEIIEDWDFDAIPETETLKVENCTQEPIITLTAEMIADCLENHLEERHSEDNAERELKKIIEVLKQNIHFETVNSKLPKLWYPNNTFTTFSMKQLSSFL